MSLLTQFYPGPGGGSSGIGPGSGSWPSIWYLGVSNDSFTFPTGGFSGAGGGGYVYSHAPAGGTPPSLTINLNGGRAQSLVVVNITTLSILRTTPDTTLENITLYGSRLSFSSGASFSALTSISGSGTLGDMGVSGLTSLTTISTDIVPTSNTIAIQDTSLDATSVNHLLTSLVDNYMVDQTVGAPRLDLAGGTAAGTSLLTAAGIAARDALVAAGWTVTLNP